MCARERESWVFVCRTLPCGDICSLLIFRMDKEGSEREVNRSDESAEEGERRRGGGVRESKERI